MFIWEGGRPCSPGPAGWGPWPGKQDPGVALGAGNVASERQRLCVHTPGPGLFRQHSHSMQCAHGECAVQGLLVTSRRGVTLAPIEFQNILSPESRSPISVHSGRGLLLQVLTTAPPSLPSLRGRTCLFRTCHGSCCAARVAGASRQESHVPASSLP